MEEIGLIDYSVICPRPPVVVSESVRQTDYISVLTLLFRVVREPLSSWILSALALTWPPWLLVGATE